MDQLVSTCVFRGAPASVYKGGEEGRLAGQRGEAQESPTPSGSRIPPPPILVGIGFAEGEKIRRGRPPLLVLIGLGEGGGAQPPWAAPFSFPLRPMKAHMAPGGFR